MKGLWLVLLLFGCITIRLPNVTKPDEETVRKQTRAYLQLAQQIAASKLKIEEKSFLNACYNAILDELAKYPEVVASRNMAAIKHIMAKAIVGVLEQYGWTPVLEK